MADVRNSVSKESLLHGYFEVDGSSVFSFGRDGALSISLPWSFLLVLESVISFGVDQLVMRHPSAGIYFHFSLLILNRFQKLIHCRWYDLFLFVLTCRSVSLSTLLSCAISLDASSCSLLILFIPQLFSFYLLHSLHSAALLHRESIGIVLGETWYSFYHAQNLLHLFVTLFGLWEQSLDESKCLEKFNLSILSELLPLYLRSWWNAFHLFLFLHLLQICSWVERYLFLPYAYKLGGLAFLISKHADLILSWLARSQNLDIWVDNFKHPFIWCIHFRAVAKRLVHAFLAFISSQSFIEYLLRLLIFWKEGLLSLFDILFVWEIYRLIMELFNLIIAPITVSSLAWIDTWRRWSLRHFIVARRSKFLWCGSFGIPQILWRVPNIGNSILFLFILLNQVSTRYGAKTSALDLLIDLLVIHVLSINYNLLLVLDWILPMRSATFIFRALLIEHYAFVLLGVVRLVPRCLSSTSILPNTAMFICFQLLIQVGVECFT